MSIFAPEQNSSRTFEPHPAGKFSAVLYDMYVLEEVNYFHGKLDQQGNTDNRFTGTKLYLCFLTSSMTEDGKPRYIRNGMSFSLGKNAKLSAVLKSWIPELRAIENLAAHFDRNRGVSLETLIGTKAFIEVSHNVKGERVYDRVDSISMLPKFDPETGEPIKAVSIPEGQKRADSTAMQIKAYGRVIEKFPQTKKHIEAAISKLQGSQEDFTAGLQEPATIGRRPANAAGDIEELPF